MIVVGIDVGTTSVKVIIVSRIADKFQVLYSTSYKHGADVSSLNDKFYEQEPSAICACLEKCMKGADAELGPDVMQQIEMISICGQMHGCMLWNFDSKGNEFYPHSSLVTWRDQRCDVGFLESLPDPKHCVPTSTGFGCATLFWLQKHKRQVIDGYACAGTIMGFIVAHLCRLPKPVMSTQNAMSWGFYNFCTEDWNVRILDQSAFPVRLLPKICRPGDAVGELQFDWCGIKAGAKVLVGSGDMQCSVYSCDPSSSTAVFNLGTSAQLSIVSSLDTGRSFYENRSLKDITSRICVPYFNENCLWVSPSLNGGAVFDMFVQELYEWTKYFSPNVTKEEIYAKIQEFEFDNETSMKIHPVVFGERHAPNIKARVEQIGESDCKISRISSELATGIIANTFQMFQQGVVENFKSSALTQPQLWESYSNRARYRKMLTKDSRNSGKTSVVSRCLKGKRRDAMDEIEAWISDTKMEFGRGNSSRVSAQPPKNVTEQKMLESKLFEMSKQRYNFMLHSKWQQKLFMEKQRQKTAIMKDLLKNVDLSKIKGENNRRGRRYQHAIPSLGEPILPKVAVSEAGRLAEEVRTVSPATVMTAPVGTSKKTVTFVTEKPNLRLTYEQSSSQNLIPPKPESNSEAPSLPDIVPVTATKHEMPEVFEAKVTKAYILPLKGRWPVRDERFLRLSQALSENYYGRRASNSKLSVGSRRMATV